MLILYEQNDICKQIVYFNYVKLDGVLMLKHAKQICGTREK